MDSIALKESARAVIDTEATAVGDLLQTGVI